LIEIFLGQLMGSFVELYKSSSPSLCKFSPNGRFLAAIVQFRLVIRDAESLALVSIFSCID
ncbi:MAG: hypothetical protein SGCHY_003771, partial [Lobulomycetales sp.]